MKSSRCSDEIFDLASDEIKSADLYSDKVGFHREAISSTLSGFLPPTADLTKKADC